MGKNKRNLNVKRMVGPMKSGLNILETILKRALSLHQKISSHFKYLQFKIYSRNVWFFKTNPHFS
jgi:hypothetical protein